uniref:Uncharacterized protein n=1 Tax=Setaria italica TaxID=4555 RepID=K3YY92_SETIT
MTTLPAWPPRSVGTSLRWTFKAHPPPPPPCVFSPGCGGDACVRWGGVRRPARVRGGACGGAAEVSTPHPSPDTAIRPVRLPDRRLRARPRRRVWIPPSPKLSGRAQAPPRGRACQRCESSSPVQQAAKIPSRRRAPPSKVRSSLSFLPSRRQLQRPSPSVSRVTVCSLLLPPINSNVHAYMDDALNVFDETGTRFFSLFSFQFFLLRYGWVCSVLIHGCTSLSFIHG